jgi:hypothetical protein
VLENTVVGRNDSLKLTTAVGANPEPFTVSVNAPLPGATDAGTKGWLMKGTGLDWAATPLLIQNKQAQIHMKLFHGDSFFTERS